MFERMTDRSRRVIVLSQEEARLLDHNYIGTEHILLGLLHEQEGIAAKALTSLNSLDKARAAIQELIGPGHVAPSGHIPFTPRSKKVLEFAMREALQLGHNYIGTEHILLGIVREGEGVASQVLAKMGVDLSTIRQTVISLLSGYTTSPVAERKTIVSIPRDVSVNFIAWFDRQDEAFGPFAPTHPAMRLRSYLQAMLDVSVDA